MLQESVNLLQYNKVVFTITVLFRNGEIAQAANNETANKCLLAPFVGQF